MLVKIISIFSIESPQEVTYETDSSATGDTEDEI